MRVVAVQHPACSLTRVKRNGDHAHRLHMDRVARGTVDGTAVQGGDLEMMAVQVHPMGHAAAVHGPEMASEPVDLTCAALKRLG